MATEFETSNFSFGQYGSDYTNSTNLVGDAASIYCVIEFDSDSIVDTITDEFGDTSYNGKSYSKDKQLFGRFKTIKLSSGSMRAYKAFPFTL